MYVILLWRSEHYLQITNYQLLITRLQWFTYGYTRLHVRGYSGLHIVSNEYSSCSLVNFSNTYCSHSRLFIIQVRLVVCSYQKHNNILKVLLVLVN